MQNLIKFLPSIIFLFVGLGFEVSGYQSSELAYIFWGLAMLLILIPIWPWLKVIRFRSPFYKRGSEKKLMNKCPVSIKFNPDLKDYFIQTNNYSDDGVRHLQRTYSCIVTNESHATLKNLTCEVDRIIDIKNRPSDSERSPLHPNVKLHFDGQGHPTRIELPSRDWQKLWLLKSERVEGKAPKMETAYSSYNFTDGGRQKDAYIKFICEGYDPKFFKSTIWVQDGILRLNHFCEVD